MIDREATNDELRDYQREAQEDRERFRPDPDEAADRAERVRDMQWR